MDFYFHYPTMDAKSEERLYSQIDKIRTNPDEIKHKIFTNMEKEKLKADSFFEHLEKFI